jgi:hypothetical protein
MVFCLPFPPVKEGDGAVTNDGLDLAQEDGG